MQHIENSTCVLYFFPPNAGAVCLPQVHARLRDALATFSESAAQRESDSQRSRAPREPLNDLTNQLNSALYVTPPKKSAAGRHRVSGGALSEQQTLARAVVQTAVSKRLLALLKVSLI
jgi:hypothetical protein